MSLEQTVFLRMIDYYAGDPKRIAHFVKVHSFAALIAAQEQADAHTRQIVSLSALVHDIGIKLSEQKYASSAGSYQELEGPPEAERLLSGIGLPTEDIERICWLIGHHHTYNIPRELDYQILVEADFLVNAYEDNMGEAAIVQVQDKIFRTAAGTRLLKTMFLSAR